MRLGSARRMEKLRSWVRMGRLGGGIRYLQIFFWTSSFSSVGPTRSESQLLVQRTSKRGNTASLTLSNLGFQLSYIVLLPFPESYQSQSS
jgi:hypothetical protein